MTPEKQAQELSDTDILQCRADILKAVGLTSPKEGPKPAPQPQRILPVGAAKPALAPTIVAVPEVKPTPLPSPITVAPAVNGTADTAQLILRQSYLESQLKDMNQQLIAREAHVKTFTAKIRESQDMISVLRNELKTSHETLQTAAAEKQVMETQLQALGQQLAAKSAAVQSGNGKDIELQATIVTLRQQIDDFRGSQQTAAGQLREKQLLVERLTETENQQKESLAAAQRQFQSQLDAVEKQKQDLQAKWQQAAGDLAESDQNSGQLRNQIEQKLQQIAALEQAQKQKQEEMSRLSEENESLRQNIRQLNSLLEQKQSEISHIGAQLDSLGQENQRLLADMENQKQQYQEKWQQAQDTLAESDQNVQQLRNQIEQKLQRIAALEQSQQHQQEEIIRLSADRESDRQNLRQVSSLLEQTQSEISEFQMQKDSLGRENQSLFDEIQNHKQQAEDLVKQLSQKETALAEQISTSESHIHELESQVRQLSARASKEATDLHALLQEYQGRLDKTELQNREIENRLTAIQAHNDRLLAGQEDTEQLREQLDQARQQYDQLNRKLERLKGDHQLVGEENNQLHHMLRLREQEMEKLRQQTEELTQKITNSKHIEVTVSDEEMEMLRSFESEPAPMEASQPEENIIETNEPQIKIPSFNLAEQIMSEHRKSVSSLRQAPGGPSQTDRKETVQRMVEQFVSPAEAQPIPQDAQDKIEIPVTSPAIMESAQPQMSLEIKQNDGLIADIVRRDIIQFLETKKQAFAKTGWMKT